MNSKSFLSSSSTLAEGLDLMAAPMEDVVGKKFPLDDEEKELKLRLEAIPSLALIFSLTSLHTSSHNQRTAETLSPGSLLPKAFEPLSSP